MYLYVCVINVMIKYTKTFKEWKTVWIKQGTGKPNTMDIFSARLHVRHFGRYHRFTDHQIPMITHKI